MDARQGKDGQEARTMRSHWHRSFKADPRARALADRHYNRQKVGAAQFVPPGKAVVLVTREADAFWVTSAPLAQYVRHAWAGAWVCSAFRNEGPVRSSLLIREAVAATRAELGEPPALGMVTFVDPTKVALGWCYRKAGFEHVGETKGGLLAFQLLPDAMPDPSEPGPLVQPDGTIQGVLA